jgi:hypothetical protein
MEHRRLRQADPVPIFGSRSVASSVLNGKRKSAKRTRASLRSFSSAGQSVHLKIGTDVMPLTRRHQAGRLCEDVAGDLDVHGEVRARFEERIDEKLSKPGEILEASSRGAVRDAVVASSPFHFRDCANGVSANGVR